MILSSSWPERPTNGSPVWSCLKPGPSPMSLAWALAEPVPGSAWIRGEPRGQARQSWSFAASSSREPDLAAVLTDLTAADWSLEDDQSEESDKATRRRRDFVSSFNS